MSNSVGNRYFFQYFFVPTNQLFRVLSGIAFGVDIFWKTLVTGPRHFFSCGAQTRINTNPNTFTRSGGGAGGRQGQGQARGGGGGDRTHIYIITNMITKLQPHIWKSARIAFTVVDANGPFSVGAGCSSRWRWDVRQDCQARWRVACAGDIAHNLRRQFLQVARTLRTTGSRVSFW